MQKLFIYSIYCRIFFLYPTLSVREVEASAGGRVVPGIAQKVDNCKGKPGKRGKPKTKGQSGKVAPGTGPWAVIIDNTIIDKKAVISPRGDTQRLPWAEIALKLQAEEPIIDRKSFESSLIKCNNIGRTDYITFVHERSQNFWHIAKNGHKCSKLNWKRTVWEYKERVSKKNSH